MNKAPFAYRKQKFDGSRKPLFKRGKLVGFTQSFQDDGGSHKLNDGGFYFFQGELKVQGLMEVFLGKMNPQKVAERIQKLHQFRQTDKPNTYESYGLVHFVNKDAIAIKGEIPQKLPDVRLVEINLSGEEAIGTSKEVPVHELTKTPHEELEIVMEGFITVEKLQEALEFVKSDKFHTQTLSIALPKVLSNEEQLKLRNVVMLLAGFRSYVLVTNTMLKIRKFVDGTDKRPPSWLWPKPFVRFVLKRKVKVRGPRGLNNFDWAMQRMGITSNPFKVSRTHFGAGWTHQFVSALKTEPELIQHGFKIDYCTVANFEISDQPVEVNLFRGYRLVFAIRKYQNTLAETQTLMENFQKNGYINYWNVSPSALKDASVMGVGKSLIENDIFGAIKQLIRPHPLEESDWEELKELYFITQNAHLLEPIIRYRLKGTAKWNLTQRTFSELLIDKQGHLGPRTASFIVSKGKPEQIIEHTDQFLYGIWNETVNLLIEKRGLKLAVGDLVFQDEGNEGYVLYERKDGPSMPRKIWNKKGDSLKDAVKALTQADIDSKEYTIHDLVIPVCGFDVKWPENDIEEYITYTLQKYNILNKEYFAQLHIKDNSNNIVFPGTYRKVINLPENLKWEICEYFDPAIPIVFDKYEKKESNVTAEPKDNVDSTKDDLEDENKEPADAEIEKKEKLRKEQMFEPQNALVVSVFIPKMTSLITLFRELFQRNYFGELANPANEPTYNASKGPFSKKLKSLAFLLTKRAQNENEQTAQQQQMNPQQQMYPQQQMHPQQEMYRQQMMPPQQTMPPQSAVPDQAMKCIQMLQEELASMRSERNQQMQLIQNLVAAGVTRRSEPEAPPSDRSRDYESPRRKNPSPDRDHWKRESRDRDDYENRGSSREKYSHRGSSRDDYDTRDRERDRFDDRRDRYESERRRTDDYDSLFSRDSRDLESKKDSVKEHMSYYDERFRQKESDGGSSRSYRDSRESEKESVNEIMSRYAELSGRSERSGQYHEPSGHSYRDSRESEKKESLNDYMARVAKHYAERFGQSKEPEAGSGCDRGTIYGSEKRSDFERRDNSTNVYNPFESFGTASAEVAHKSVTNDFDIAPLRKRTSRFNPVAEESYDRSSYTDNERSAKRMRPDSGIDDTYDRYKSSTSSGRYGESSASASSSRDRWSENKFEAAKSKLAYEYGSAYLGSKDRYRDEGVSRAPYGGSSRN